MPFRPFSPGIALLLLASCGPDHRSAIRPDAAVPRWQGSVDLVLAPPQARDTGRLGSLVTGPDGRVYLAAAGGAVLVFDSAGRPIPATGDLAGSPGRRSCCLATRDNELWVGDTEAGTVARYSFHETGAKLETSRRMADYRLLNHPFRFDTAGRPVALARTGTGDLVVVRLDSVGVQVLDTIPVPPGDSLGLHRVISGGDTVIMRQPYGPELLVALAPGGGWARAIGSRYLVDWHDAAGGRVVRRDLIGPALSLRERQSGDSMLRAEAANAGTAGDGLPFGVPGAKPPVAGVMFDRQGRLWVEMSVADGERHRADLYDSAGKRLAMAEWAADIALLPGSLDERTAWGVRPSAEGGVEVVRVRFAP